MKLLPLISLLMLSCLNTSVFAAGVPVTRIVYQEEERTLRQRIINNDAQPMLIKVWIDDQQSKPLAGVVITPNVFLMKPESERVVKVLNLNSLLQPDRESLYYFNTMAVPPEEERVGMGVVTPVTARNKLLLRPVAMKGLRLEDAVQQLKWSIKDGQVEVTNLSPFHIVISKLSLNGEPQNIDLLLPKSTRLLESPVSQKTAEIKLAYIDDRGTPSPIVTLPIQ